MSVKGISEGIDHAYTSIVNALNHFKRHGMVERGKRGKCYPYAAVFDFVRITHNEGGSVREPLNQAMRDLEDEELYREIWGTSKSVCGVSRKGR